MHQTLCISESVGVDHASEATLPVAMARASKHC